MICTYCQKRKISIILSLLFVCASAYADTASWYGTTGSREFTASGERFNENALTAASWRYPFGTELKVTNIRNGKSVVVRVNDRGPAKRLVKKGRVIDLSRKAFSQIEDLRTGIVNIKVEVIK